MSEPVAGELRSTDRGLLACVALEGLLGLAWLGTVISSERLRADALYLLLLTAVLAGPCMIAGAWLVFRGTASRRLALAVVLAPIAWLVLPFAVRAVTGPLPVPRPRLALALTLGLPLATCVVQPRRAAELLPTGLLRSRLLNGGLVLVLGVLLASIVGLLGVLLRAAGGGGVDATGLRDASVLTTFVLAGAVTLALPALLYAWLGLFQHRDRSRHRLGVTQLTLALAILACGLAALPFTFLALVNPG